MSPTSYQLLYPAMFGTAKVANFFEIPNFRAYRRGIRISEKE